MESAQIKVAIALFMMLLSSIVALNVWVVKSINSLHRTVAVMEARQESAAEQRSDLKEAIRSLIAHEASAHRN